MQSSSTRVNSDQTAHGSSQTNKPVIEARQTNGREELEVDSGTFLLNSLRSDNTLTILLADALLLLSQVVQRIRAGNSTEQQAKHPTSVCLLSQPLGHRTLPDARSIQVCDSIQRQVSSISQLSSNSAVLDNGIQALGICRDSCRFEVLDVLAHTHQLACQPKLLLDGIERSDLPGRTVRAVKIPGVEAREVLDCSEELVTAHCRGYVLEVVSHRGVVDEGVGDHLGGVVYIL